jgi:hypothetical protein
MKPVASLILSAIMMFLAVVLAFVLFGALLDIIRCIVVGTIIAIGGTYLYRRLTQRYTPAPKQIIDQPPSPSDSKSDTADIARQIEARKERLGQ